MSYKVSNEVSCKVMVFLPKAPTYADYRKDYNKVCMKKADNTLRV